MTTSVHELPFASPRGMLLVILLAACALSPHPADACGGAVASLKNSSSGSSNINNDKKTKTTTTLLQKTTTSPKATTKSTSTGTGTSSTNTTIKKAASTNATAAATKKNNKEKIVTHNVSHVGYLVDLLCWNRPGQRRLPIHPLLNYFPCTGHVALDGAPLRTAPEAHTVYCMRDIPACRQSDFGILERIYETPPPPPPPPPSAVTDATATDAAEKEEDLEPPPTNLIESELQSAPPPVYFLKYRLDAAGNAMALELLDATVKEDDYLVLVTGTVQPPEEQGALLLSDVTLQEVEASSSDKDV